MQGTSDKPAGGAVDQQVLQRIKALETENNNLKKSKHQILNISLQLVFILLIL